MTAVAPGARTGQPRYLTFDERPAAAWRLYCFPFAGGTAAAFRQWRQHLPLSVELRVCQLPGRHDRLHEAPAADVGRLAEMLVDDLVAEGDDRPFAFFGHSLGSLIAFEVTRELRRRERTAPRLLAVSARPAPHLPAYRGQLHDRPDGELLAALSRLGGIPAEVLDRQQLIDLSLPAIRADLRLSETYTPTPHTALGEDRVPCPLLVSGGDQDPLVSFEELEGWRRYASGPVTVTQYPGDHFYLWPEGRFLVRSIVSAMAATSGPGAGSARMGALEDH